MTRKPEGPSWEWNYTTLKPASAAFFDIEVPEGFGVFIKRWYYGVVMIDSIATQGVGAIQELKDS